MKTLLPFKLQFNFNEFLKITLLTSVFRSINDSSVLPFYQQLPLDFIIRKKKTSNALARDLFFLQWVLGKQLTIDKKHIVINGKTFSFLSVLPSICDDGWCCDNYSSASECFFIFFSTFQDVPSICLETRMTWFWNDFMYTRKKHGERKKNVMMVQHNKWRKNS